MSSSSGCGWHYEEQREAHQPCQFSSLLIWHRSTCLTPCLDAALWKQAGTQFIHSPSNSTSTVCEICFGSLTAADSSIDPNFAVHWSWHTVGRDNYSACMIMISLAARGQSIRTREMRVKTTQTMHRNICAAKCWGEWSKSALQMPPCHSPDCTTVTVAW